MKKIMTFLLLSSLCAGVVLGAAGCGNTEETIKEIAETPAVSSEPSSSYTASSEAPISYSSSSATPDIYSSSESSSSESGTRPVSENLRLVKETLTNIVYDKKFACEIPRIEGGEGNPDIEGINAEISEYRERFEYAYNNDQSGGWVVVDDHSHQNDRYINIITAYNEYPAGSEPGYDEVQTLINYVYDTQEGRILSTEEIMSGHDLTSDFLQDRFRSFMNSMPETKNCEIDHFNIVGAGLAEDGSCSIYIDVSYHNPERDQGPEETGTYYSYDSDIDSFNMGLHWLEN